MELVLIGTGSPEIGPENTRAGTSAAISLGDDVLLFDCGRWITLRLCQAGIHPRQVTRLFITHKFHLDHTVSYYDFLFSSFGGKPFVYGPPGMKEYTKDLLACHAKHGDRGRTKGEDFVDNVFDYVEKGTICSGKDWKVDATNVEINTRWPPTIVYRLEYGGRSVVMAWDIHPRFDLHQRKPDELWNFDDSYTSRKELMDIMEGADIVLADAMEIHTTPEGIGIASEKAKVKKVVLTHLTGAGTLWPPLDPVKIKERVKKAFGGEVVIGRDLLKIEI